MNPHTTIPEAPTRTARRTVVPLAAVDTLGADHRRGDHQSNEDDPRREATTEDAQGFSLLDPVDPCIQLPDAPLVRRPIGLSLVHDHPLDMLTVFVFPADTCFFSGCRLPGSPGLGGRCLPGSLGLGGLLSAQPSLGRRVGILVDLLVLALGTQVSSSQILPQFPSCHARIPRYTRNSLSLREFMRPSPGTEEQWRFLGGYPENIL
jgi:hypothetical protein